jgi:hypothetical protein
MLFLLTSATNGMSILTTSEVGKIVYDNLDEPVLFDSDAGNIISKIDGGSPSACLEAIDYDSDGDMDYIEGSNEFIFINTNAEGNFIKTLVYSFFWSPEPGSGYINTLVYGDIAVGDLNNDGQQDFITGGNQGRIRIFINNNSQQGIPHFDNVSLIKFGQSAYGIDIADFNDDGWLDFAVSWATRPLGYSSITLFYNDGHLNFIQEKEIFTINENYIADLDIGDYDNDGDYDIIFTKNIYKWHRDLPWNVIGAYYILENRGDDTFESKKLIAERGRDIMFYFGANFYLHVQCPIRHYFGYDRINPKMTSADFDNDGDIDFLVGDNSGMVEFFINDGQGNFMSDGIIHRYGHLSWGLASADFDNDGDIDFIVGALDEYQDYYNGHVWLKQNNYN